MLTHYVQKFVNYISMALIQIPPSNHLKGSLSRVVNNASKVTSSTLDRIMTGTIVFTFAPPVAILDMVIYSLISYIQVTGKSNDCRRKLGPKWQDDIKQAVCVDFMRGYNLAQIVQNDPQYSWSTVRDSYGSVKALRMTNLLFQILSANTGGFYIAGTGYRFFYDFKLKVGVDFYEHWAKGILTDKFDTLKNSGYKSNELYGVLATLKDGIIPELYLTTPQPTVGTTDPMCVGDVLFNDGNTINLETLSESSYHILHSEGVSPMSMAFNIFFSSELENETVNGINLTKFIFFELTGSPKVEVLELITNVAFGLSYTDGQLLSDDIQPFGNGPEGPKSPQGPGNKPSNPEGNDGTNDSGEKESPPTSDQSTSKGSDSPRPESNPPTTYTKEQLSGELEVEPKSTDYANSLSPVLTENITEVLGEQLTDKVIDFVGNQMSTTPTIKQKTLVKKVLSKVPGVTGKFISNVIPLAVSALYLNDRNRTLQGSVTNTSLGIGLKGPYVSRSTTEAKLKPVKSTDKS